MSAVISSERLRAWAEEERFDLAGVARAGAVGAEQAEALRGWLARGGQGGMAYLARGVEERLDVRRLAPGARSVVCVGVSYFTGGLAGGSAAVGRAAGRVARYAWGRDYHEVVRERLGRLAERVRASCPQVRVLRCFVDTAPLLEKAWAAGAGLGWIGKNGLLINERLGSWLVLGEIVTDLEFDRYGEPAAGGCGACRRCLEACPTGALAGEAGCGGLDARRCISYLTVEGRGELPGDLAGRMGDWLFGCDVCQEVCPFNERAARTADGDFLPRGSWARPELGELLGMGAAEFARRFAGSSVARAGYEHLRRVAENCWRNLGRGVEPPRRQGTKA